MACDEVLSSLVYYRRLAVATAWAIRFLKLSRRGFGNLLADVIFGFLAQGGRIYSAAGKEVHLSDTAIDDAFGGGEDGSDFRWLSDFIIRGINPKQRPPESTLRKLRLIDLYFRLAMPDIAKHFGR